ncbi:hypothetical protein H0E87_025976 [Populus deltoides]|uniref:Uncharacterized protein n=1 Tax=Populus deltoides TaxID=3696 RepID=A0A8T2X1V7_POPDE|nr:hypothetical protein H0E87_025976 [Populus deltoides]
MHPILVSLKHHHNFIKRHDHDVICALEVDITRPLLILSASTVGKRPISKYVSTSTAIILQVLYPVVELSIMLQGLHKSSKVPEGEMDRGKEKRKRGDKESEQGRKRKVRGGEGKEEVVTVATEEEVEEFFAILRRMQEAAKYFGKSSGEGWRAAVEAEVVKVIDGGGNNEEENMIQSSGAEEVAAVVEEEENGVLDLNATPVAESDGA